MNIPKESISERIRQILLDRILDGTYKPGERLVELTISKELKTSQAPVREALRSLQAMHLIECEPYKGTRVREMSVYELQESFFVRSNLEAIAAQLAAVKFQNNVEELSTINRAFEKSIEEQDYKAAAQNNAEFHRLIVAKAENSVLLRVWDSLSCEAWTLIHIQQMVPDPNKQKISIDEHQAIIEALREGNGLLAGELLKQHSLRLTSENNLYA